MILTKENNQQVIINVESVVSMERAPESGSVIYVKQCEKSKYIVKETLEEIIKMINN